MNEVMREEKKYALDVAEGAVLRTRLAQVMHADAHNGARGYSIRSLYFDTLDDQDFWDKIEGIELRRKIRLRIYSPADTVAKLEMKQKQGPYQKKRSLAISRADAIALCAGTTARFYATAILSRRNAMASCTTAATARGRSWNTVARRSSRGRTTSVSPSTATSAPQRRVWRCLRRIWR